MNCRCLFQVTVCLVSVFHGFSASGTASAINSPFCFWTRSLSDGHTHHMFLRQRQDNERPLLLYDSIWSKDDTLVNCITSNDPAVTEIYKSKCWGTGSELFSDTSDSRFNISALVGPAGPCVALSHLSGIRSPVRRSRDLESVDRDVTSVQHNDGESSGSKRRRSKRAWIIPGTLWCGAGDKASAFADLGMFEETDKCCREHDHCQHSISSFEYNYGVFNTNIFTLSHCDCDKKFRRCLHSANDRMADVVGYAFFNILKMRCFEFSQRMECAKRAWWGICEVSQLTPYALVKEPANYTSTVPELDDDMLDLIPYYKISVEDLTTTGCAVSSTTLSKEVWIAGEEKSTVFVPERTSSTHLHEETTDVPQTQMTNLKQTLTTDTQEVTVSLQTQMTDSPLHRTTYSTGTQTDSLEKQTADSLTKDSTQTWTVDTAQKQTNSPHLPTDSQTATTQSPQTTDSALTKLTASPQTQTKIPTQPEIPTKQRGKLEVCEGYKDLDSCRHQIPALQEKFGVRNAELTTLYHCSCTSRLAREIAGHNVVDEVHLLLLDFVSQFCFILHENCTESESCPMSTQEPLVQRWTKDVAAWQHLVGSKRKAKRLNSKRAKRKDSTFRLYKKCLRMHFKLHKPKEQKFGLQDLSTPQ